MSTRWWVEVGEQVWVHLFCLSQWVPLHCHVHTACGKLVLLNELTWQVRAWPLDGSAGSSGGGSQSSGWIARVSMTSWWPTMLPCVNSKQVPLCHIFTGHVGNCGMNFQSKRFMCSYFECHALFFFCYFLVIFWLLVNYVLTKNFYQYGLCSLMEEPFCCIAH